MVELCSRIDELFDHLRRGDREMLVDFPDRFEKAYKQYVEAGEVLSERARLNRLFRESRLHKHEQREILMNNLSRVAGSTMASWLSCGSITSSTAAHRSETRASSVARAVYSLVLLLLLAIADLQLAAALEARPDHVAVVAEAAR